MTLGIRGLEVDDRDRLLRWRNAPHVRAVSSSDAPIEPEQHAAWFERVLAERADQMLIVTFGGEPAGVVQLEGLDLADMTSSWGVHLGDAVVHPAVGATLPLIGLGLGFGRFGLRRMTAVVLSSNTKMVSMHRRLQIPAEGCRRQAARRSDGTHADVHEYGVLAAEWPEVIRRGESLLPKAIRRELQAVLGDLDASAE